jgi:hypothetical protein
MRVYYIQTRGKNTGPLRRKRGREPQVGRALFQIYQQTLYSEVQT